MMSALLLSCALVSLAWLSTSTAALSMPQVFGSHMVLQRGSPSARIWGEASPSAKVLLVIDAEPALAVQADDTGRFLFQLQPRPVSWNHTMTVSADGESVVFADVAFGDVVLCLGQSNMELSLNYTFGGAETIADSINHPSIRLFTVAWNKSPVQLNDTQNRWSGSSWRVSSPEAVDCGPGCGFGYFASTCFYYGLAIDNALQGKVPLGLLQVTFGGTWVEEWTRAAVVPQCGEVPHNNATTGYIWNGMVAPVVNFTAHLTLYYQGETNTDSSADALHFGCMFRAMVTDLRGHQQRGQHAPFYFVLLAPAHNGTSTPRALIQGWQSQLEALSLPGTRIANTIDLGDVSPLINELHPRNKSLIGQRLARIALNDLYDQPMVFRGPSLNVLTDIEAQLLNRSHLSLTFRFPSSTETSLLHIQHTAECDSCCDGVSSALFGVTVLSTGRRYLPPSIDIDVQAHTLRAVIELKATDARALTHFAAQPIRVDFEQVDSYPQCALYNEANLPALPFGVELTVSASPIAASA